MLAICMNYEEEFKEMIANDLFNFLNGKINYMKKLYENGQIDGMKLYKFLNIDDTLERLKDKYLLIKKNFLNDPKLASDNGRITQIINHKKFYDSITFWIGTQQ